MLEEIFMIRKILLLALVFFLDVSVFRCRDLTTTTYQDTSETTDEDEITSTYSTNFIDSTTSELLTTITEKSIEEQIQDLRLAAIDYCNNYTNVSATCILYYDYLITDYDYESNYTHAHDVLYNELGYDDSDYLPLLYKMYDYIYCYYRYINYEQAAIDLEEYNDLLNEYSLQAQADLSAVIELNTVWSIFRIQYLEPLSLEMMAIADFREPSGSVAGGVNEFYNQYRLLRNPDPYH